MLPRVFVVDSTRVGETTLDSEFETWDVSAEVGVLLGLLVMR